MYINERLPPTNITSMTKDAQVLLGNSTGSSGQNQNKGVSDGTINNVVGKARHVENRRGTSIRS